VTYWRGYLHTDQSAEVLARSAGGVIDESPRISAPSQHGNVRHDGSTAGRPLWGWAGSVADFLATPAAVWRASLEHHHQGLLNQRPSSSQLTAWDAEGEIMRASLRDVCIAAPDAVEWGIAFEFELPLENGRRPDVVVLAGDAIAVLEFKLGSLMSPAAVDQVRAYARDLAEYHEASHGRQIQPILVLTTASHAAPHEGVAVIDGPALAGELLATHAPGSVELSVWLRSPYAPLPTLIAAARHIFQHQPLPAVRRALSTGIPEAVELLGQLAEGASTGRSRVLAFVAGVPGSGKTLAGLTLVYERADRMSSATFLSGNGPLVEVLRDALQSKAFVRDLHAFITTYGRSDRVPREHVIVFDEAQRAWDRGYMLHKHGIERSEPDLLIEVGERLPGWAVLVGLVGDGQEIHAGEEAGIEQWRDAMRPPNTAAAWTVHCPPRLGNSFRGLRVVEHPSLDLTTSLRSRRADRLHEWVARLLSGDLSTAARHAVNIQAESFPMYLTRDLEHAKSYAVERYVDEPGARYGLLASARTQSFLPKFGVDTSFPATKRVKLARWYNEGRGHPQSCCALNDAVTEFGSQGLELDLPIVCWGNDMMWNGREWVVRPVRARYPLRDNQKLRRNAYRVLLTRGRDGLVVFLPPAQLLDLTEHALLAAGVRPLPSLLDQRLEA
jgi:hypothetical protein